MYGGNYVFLNYNKDEKLEFNYKIACGLVVNCSSDDYFIGSFNRGKQQLICKYFVIAMLSVFFNKYE